MTIAHRTSARPRHAIVASLLVIAALGLGAFAAVAQDGTPTPAGTPCVLASPGAVAATPAAPDVDVDAAATLGTPVVAACLTVTLRAGEPKAGPQDLTVEVRDPNGAPVSDAGVVILTRHLEMNHGTSTNEAVATGPGVYVAKRVAMGMGGTWQAEVVITRPGYEPVVAVFVIRLEGPH
jgi:hypothetical protein